MAQAAADPRRHDPNEWTWRKTDSKEHDLAWKHLNYYLRTGKKFPALQTAVYSLLAIGFMD